MMLRLLPGTLDPGIRSPGAYLDRPEGQNSGPETPKVALHLLRDGRDPETPNTTVDSLPRTMTMTPKPNK